MSHLTATQTVSGKLTRQRVAELRVQCQKDPGSTELHRNAVAEFLHAGMAGEALPLLRRLTALCPGDMDTLKQLAMVLAETGDDDGAKESYRLIAASEAESTEAQHNLGVAACHVGDHNLAIEAFERKLALDATSFETHNDLAVLYTMTGRADDSARAYLRCLEINPRYEKARENAFQFFWDHQRGDEGLKLADRILGIVGPDTQVTVWRDRFAGVEPSPPARIETRAVAHSGSSRIATRVTNKKIAFVASSDTFLTPIVEHFARNNSVRIFNGQSSGELAGLLGWADLTWFEWCDQLTVAAMQMPKSGKWICRLHSYEAFTDAPSHVDWGKVDRLILVNESVGQILDQFWKVPAERSVVHNGVDPGRFPFVSREPRGKKIASVGYINYKKNPSLLLQTFNAIHAWDPEFELHVAGTHQDPRIRVYFDELLPRLNLPITFHGWVEDMPSFYAQMDYVISTSLFESFHYSVAEGMLSGALPLVHGWKGADGLYPANSLFDTPAQAIERIQGYLTGKTGQIARDNREHIISRYAWTDRLDQLDDVLNGVLNGSVRHATATRRRIQNVPVPPKSDRDFGVVSVVIPSANNADGIGHGVQTALNQSYAHREVIVCDDGSSDDTEMILNEFGDTIKVISQVRRGVPAALNRAIQASRGEFIAFLHPDDAFAPEKLDRQLARLASAPSVGLITCGAERYENGASDTPQIPSLNEPAIAGSRPAFSSVVIRRNVLEQVGWFDENAPETIPDEQVIDALFQRIAAVSDVDALDEPLVRIATTRGSGPSASSVCDATESSYRRWVDVVCNREPRTAKTPKPQKSGGKIVFVGAVDPGGQMAAWTEFLNEHTTHSVRLLTHSETMGYPSDLVLSRRGHGAISQSKTEEKTEKKSLMATLDEANDAVRDADVVVFAAGLAPGCLRADTQLNDTDEQPFGTLDWPSLINGKRCAGLLFGTPSVRANLGWYRDRFAAKGWPVLTCAPDIHRWLTEAHYLPRVLGSRATHNGMAKPQTGMLGILHPGGRHPHEGGVMFHEAAVVVKERHPSVSFGQYRDMAWPEVLDMKKRAQIGIDRIAVGAGDFGIASLENSALGLVNITWCDPYARALIAQSLGTDELPWDTPATTDELIELLCRYASDPDLLGGAMKTTRDWFASHWNGARVIQVVASALCEL